MRVLLILLAASLCGCAYQAGSSGKTALLADETRSTMHFNFWRGVEMIDNTPTDLPTHRPLLPKDVAIGVAPGSHRLLVLHDFGGNMWTRWQFNFLFEGGHSYRLEVSNVNTKLWITDEQTDVKVALDF